MRNIVLILFITVMSFPIKTWGQVSFGIKGGASFSNTSFKETDFNGKAIFGFHAGLLTEIGLGKNFLLRPEILYAQKGWRLSGTSEGITFHYITMPLLLGYCPRPKLCLLAGPEIGRLLKETNSIDIYEKNDFGICVGSCYNLSKNLGVEVRYVYGIASLVKFSLRDANNSNLGTLTDGTNKTLQVSLYYKFKKG